MVEKIHDQNATSKYLSLMINNLSTRKVCQVRVGSFFYIFFIHFTANVRSTITEQRHGSGLRNGGQAMGVDGVAGEGTSSQELISFKKYMPPPLPYFKVNICPLPLPHFASIFFAYL